MLAVRCLSYTRTLQTLQLLIGPPSLSIVLREDFDEGDEVNLQEVTFFWLEIMNLPVKAHEMSAILKGL